MGERAVHRRGRDRVVAATREPARVVDGRRRLRERLSGWQFSTRPVVYTLGAAFDIVPAAIFLHVFLAFPDGRLWTRLERVLVAAAYVASVGLQVVKLMLGGVEPRNLLELSAQQSIVKHVEDVQLLSLSVLFIAGVGVLMARWRRFGRPRRRSLALLIDSFALGLVLVALLFVLAASDLPGFSEVRRAMLFVIGLAPFAFLLGVLDARLARSAVGLTPAERRLLGVRADADPRHEGDGDRAGGRRADRRHDRARRAPAGVDEAARRLELVPAELARVAPAA
jgi:hypothetical protein